MKASIEEQEQTLKQYITVPIGPSAVYVDTALHCTAQLGLPRFGRLTDHAKRKRVALNHSIIRPLSPGLETQLRTHNSQETCVGALRGGEKKQWAMDHPSGGAMARSLYYYVRTYHGRAVIHEKLEMIKSIDSVHNCDANLVCK